MIDYDTPRHATARRGTRCPPSLSRPHLHTSTQTPARARAEPSIARREIARTAALAQRRTTRRHATPSSPNHQPPPHPQLPTKQAQHQEENPKPTQTKAKLGNSTTRHDTTQTPTRCPSKAHILPLPTRYARKKREEEEEKFIFPERRWSKSRNTAERGKKPLCCGDSKPRATRKAK
jgi:hypothetical protein